MPRKLTLFSHREATTILTQGEIERFFRTVRAQVLPSFTGQTLEQLNQTFGDWLFQEYHRRPHSATAQPPLERFSNHLELIRKPPVDMDEYFRKEVRRRVNKDRTVSIDGRVYEAPTKLIGEQISLLFHEESPERVEIIHCGQTQGFLVPLDLYINNQVRREASPQPTVKQGGRLPFGASEVER